MSSPNTWSLIPAEPKQEEQNFDFHALDQVFLSPEVVKNETLNMLAQLELRKHKLRMELVINNMDGNVKLQSGNTVGDELIAVDNAMTAMMNKFSDVLQINVR